MRKKEAEDGGPQVQLGSLDVKDAFPQVPQDEPTQVTTATGHFEVRRNLPGLRIGAKAWFGWLREKGFEFSKTNPCLGKFTNKMTVPIHVDDVLHLGEKEYVMDYFLPNIKDRFEISEQHLTGPGSSFQFLRRTYEETETGLKVHPGKYAENMVEMYEEKMGRAKVQSLPRSQEMLEADGTTQLRPDLAGLYSQERLDVSYVIKELAGSMSCPTTGSLKELGKLVGYPKNTMGQYSMLEIGEPGEGLSTITTKGRWLLETFSDSDWSGSKSHRRSTSAAIHVANGVVIFASSRGQKSVTLLN